MPAGLLTGTLGAVAVTLAGTAVTAKLVDQEMLPQENIGYAVMVLLITAAWTGASLSANQIKRRRGLVCLLSGTCFYGLLLAVTALLFGGHYDGVGETALLVFCGSLLPVTGKSGGKSRTKMRRVKIRNC